MNGLLDGSIPIRVQAAAIVASVALLMIIIHFVRQGRLKEGYSILWLIIAFAAVILSVFTGLLEQLAGLVGISYSPAALLLVLIGGLFLLALHFSLLHTRIDRKIRDMAREHAILKERFERKHVHDE